MVDTSKYDELLATPLPVEKQAFSDITELTPIQLFATVLTRDYFAGGYKTIQEYQEDERLHGIFDGLTVEQFNHILAEADHIVSHKRGLPPFNRSSEVFDAEFIAACNVMADVMDRRSDTAKLKTVGLTTLQWKNMLEMKANYEYWHAIVDKLFDQTVFEAGRVALGKNVAAGDLASIKYFNEMMGRYKSTSEFDPRIITIMLQGILGVITNHVTGEVANAIADEIDKVALQTLQRGITDGTSG